MLNVKLIDYTGKGLPTERWHAARILQFTKNTRLEMTPQTFDAFMAAKFSQDEVLNELEYMSSTIASSWEFIHLTFAIVDVSRACAQQITRTRTASYAMQSQRVTDMSKATCHIPDTIPQDKLVHYQLALSTSLASYQRFIADGMAFEDARGVLPLNVHCNLLAQYNFRAWIDLIRSRGSLRVQDEYRTIVSLMQAEVLRAWPWAMLFLQSKHDKAIKIIEEVARDLPQPQRTQLAKAADLLKKDTA